jgi:methylmalonyl-CoA/ethylmalonyl-CoA epimerase
VSRTRSLEIRAVSRQQDDFRKLLVATREHFSMKLTLHLILAHIARGEIRLSMEKFTFHHVGVAVKDLKEAIGNYKNLFGYEVTSGPFDDPIQNVSVCFLSRGESDPAIELVAPLGPNSPIDRILKKGGGSYHVCYQVPDIDGAIRHLSGHGALLISGPDPAVAFSMRKIAWLLTGTGLLVELVQAESDIDAKL